ncbi:MAG: ribosome silencing factor [Robiginitomaculum sp.]|nr:MAG: ribosome silencing factor [Robiginitomaculum sp.]
MQEDIQKDMHKSTRQNSAELADFIYDILDTQSAEDIVRLNLAGKSSIADVMIVASGRSNRHVSALSDYILRGLKEIGLKKLGIEGNKQNDWVLIDAGDVIVHMFRPEVREFYALEKLWSVSPTSDDINNP